MLALAFDGITSLSNKPIRLITGAGIVVSLISFIGVIWAIVQAAMGSVVACALFGAVVGDTLSGAIAMAAIALPEMRRYRYDDTLAVGTLACSSTIGALIPPSTTFILYGVLAEQSEVLLDDSQRATGWHEDANQEREEREARNELKHVAGLGELQDVTEVEYRKVRLERVVLVGVWSSAVTTQAKAEESLRELAALAETAGAVVCDGLLQHRSKPDAATYVGSGKAKEIADIVAREEADTIIVDDDLPPSQRRALEDAAKVKVVDRTAVILDIFAQHATSREGKAQVELAQLEYMLPRLRGWGGSLSRQAGGRAAGADAGIGSRGPGETKIEMDRRVIRTRIARLRRQIREMAPAREVKRGSRRRFGLPTVAVVGYTNAGKSSLTNRLTGSAELVENALFATLDTAVRRAKTRDGRAYAYVDTVGFVRRLPTQLVEAFKSTLEEVAEADVILHVVDGSHPDPFSQVDAVNDVLADIEGTASIPRILVFNKADQADEATR